MLSNIGSECEGNFGNIGVQATLVPNVKTPNVKATLATLAPNVKATLATLAPKFEGSEC
jgi:hypothetical protein